MGKKESFGLKEWAEFGEWTKKIRKFHEVTEAKATLRIPILSDILLPGVSGRASPETRVSGRSYTIDPVNGSDENDGSSTAPWKSFRKINSYYQAS